MTAYEPRLRLLGAVLAALASSSCDSRDIAISYVPGETRAGDSQTLMPPFPCLPPYDPLLRAFNPGCENYFAIVAGPVLGTNAEGKATCDYIAEESDKWDGMTCEVGRPLSSTKGTIVAPLVHVEAWRA